MAAGVGVAVGVMFGRERMVGVADATGVAVGETDAVGVMFG